MHSLTLDSRDPAEETLAKFGGVGPKTRAAAQVLLEGRQLSLFADEANDSMLELARTFLSEEWSDVHAAAVLKKVGERISIGRPVNLLHLNRWLLAHKDNSDAVIDCLNVDPPDETEILRVLSRAGSQKVVFLATWSIGQQEVVLKQIVGSNSEAIYAREAVPHPLNMTHENIVETHQIKNRNGARFLLEKRLDLVLDDKWDSEGNHEAANLLHDILSALYFLHEKKLIHGDIKPDNIGRRRHSYILLDFGICRPREEFIAHGSATGSLRTRAPELILRKNTVEPEKADIWALGATVYNSIVGRFPLIESAERIPRISDPDDREIFEQKLKRRIQDEWDQWVNLDRIPSPMKEVLLELLSIEPNKRPSARSALETVRTRLSVYLRQQSTPGQFAPIEHYNQFRDFFRKPHNVELLPQNRRHAIAAKLKNLLTVQGFDSVQIGEMKTWITRVDV